MFCGDVDKIKVGDIIRVTYPSDNSSVFQVRRIGSFGAIYGKDLHKYGNYEENIAEFCADRFVQITLLETKEQYEKELEKELRRKENRK